MILWGGKLVLQDKVADAGVPASPEKGRQNVHSPSSAESARATPRRQSGGNSDACLPLALSASEKQHFEDVIQPFVTSLVRDMLQSETEKPTIFCLHWLLEQLQVPGSLSRPLLSWLNVPPDRSRSQQARTSTKPVSATEPAPAPASAPPTARLDATPPTPLRSCLRPSLKTSNVDRRKASDLEQQEPEAVAASSKSSAISGPASCFKGSKSPVKTIGDQIAALGNDGSVSSPLRRFQQDSSVNGTSGPNYGNAGEALLNLTASSAASAGGGSSPSRETKGEAQTKDQNGDGTGREKILEIKNKANSRVEANTHRAAEARKMRFKHLAGDDINGSRSCPEVTNERRIDLIRQNAIFRNLTDDEVHDLSLCAKVECFGDEHPLSCAGESNDEFHIVVSGEGRVMQRVQVGTLYAGDSFGEHVLMKRHLGSSLTSSAHAIVGSEKSFTTLTLSYGDIEQRGLLPKLRKKNQTEMDQNKVIARTDTMKKLHSMYDSSSGIRGTCKHEKTDEQRAFICKSISSNVHVQNWLELSEKQIEFMADLMEKRHVSADENVTVKGERGDAFFVVEDGLLEIIVDSGQTEKSLGASIRCGDSFGELALLYNTPRKATIRAMRECVLWTITRHAFCAVMKLKSDVRIQQYEDLVNQVPLLTDRLDYEQRRILADTLEEVFFVKDEDVVQQGDDGHTFFLIYQGTCEVRVHNKVVATIEKGMYFGEKALLNREPRAATVRVASETATLLALDHASFDLILSNALQDMKSDKALELEELRSKNPSSKMLQHRSSIDLMKHAITRQERRRQAGVDDLPLSQLTQVGVLGSGTYGDVTLQRDKITGKLFALKSMSKSYIQREKLKHMVRNEKKTMLMLDSPFVVHLYRTYVDSRYYYLLMEPAHGGELYSIYTKMPDMYGSEKHAKFYCCCTVFGLDHLHSKRIIYRDLKLENVLLQLNGYSLLTDMGCAKVVIGKTYTICGTADYFAPETLKRVGHNRAVDWWALGVLIFIMMSGRSPFDADDVMQIYKNINKGFNANTFPKSFPKVAVDVVNGLCRKKPEERLGMGIGGIRDLFEHPFFEDIDWEKVQEQQWQAPFLPPEINLQEIAKRKHDPRRHTEIWDKDDGDSSGLDIEF